MSPDELDLIGQWISSADSLVITAGAEMGVAFLARFILLAFVRFLATVAARLNPGGLLVLALPYTWLEE